MWKSVNFSKHGSRDETVGEAHDIEFEEESLDYNLLYPENYNETKQMDRTKPRKNKADVDSEKDGKSMHDLGRNDMKKSYEDYDTRQDCLEEGLPNVTMAYKSGMGTEHVQCNVVRIKSAISSSSYELRLEKTNEPLIIAKKINLSRKGNYHFFDMTRGQVGESFSKKGGNFLGKLEYNLQGTEFALLNQASKEEEVAGFMFDSTDNLKHIKGNRQFRRLIAVLPKLTSDGFSVPYSVAENGNVSITDICRNTFDSERPNHTVHKFESKKPLLVGGDLRLNFKGRVGIASVKNFQLTFVDEPDNVVVQFGKIDDDRFNLDFKAPFNAFQAFSLVLSQFIL